jgi:hypothetical protein
MPTADENLIKKWDERFKACAAQRTNFERQWHANLAFYFGRQWIQFQSTVTGSNIIGFSITEPKLSENWRVRHVSNKCKRIVRTEITKLTKEEPQFYTVPETTEEHDRAAALAADAISDYLLHSRYFNVTRSRATFWLSVTGTGFIKTFYDEEQLDVDGKPGKLIYEAPSPFHIFVPYLQVQDIEDQPYVFNCKAIDPDLVQSFYGKAIEGSQSTANDILESRFLTSLGVKNVKSETLRQCYIKEAWVKPCKDFPKGVMFVYGEGKLLYMYDPRPAEDNQLPMMGNGIENILQTPPREEVSEYPYKHRQYPFAKLDHVPTGRFYAQSVLDDIIPIQKDYNRTRSIQKEAANLAGKPQYWMNKGSYDANKHSAKPGLLLQVNPGFEGPHLVETPPPAQGLKEELDYSVQDMDDISGQFEVAKGRTPPGVEAASAIAYLQEENDTILFHTVESIEAAIQKIGIQSLSLVHEFWTEDRVVRAVSTNSYFEAKVFKGADLNPFMDFRVESQSMAPRSRAAKQAFITELLKIEALPVEKALRYLQMNETNKMYEELMIDSRQAQRENYMMAQGTELVKPSLEVNPDDPMGKQTVPRTNTLKDIDGKEMKDDSGQPIAYNVTVNDFDNHPTHVYEHENYCKSQEFELLTPQIQQIILNHIQEHKQEIMQEQIAQQQLGMGPAGAESGGEVSQSGTGAVSNNGQQQY